MSKNIYNHLQTGSMMSITKVLYIVNVDSKQNTRRWPRGTKIDNSCVLKGSLWTLYSPFVEYQWKHTLESPANCHDNIKM
jgi:hypothetical protein